MKLVKKVSDTDWIGQAETSNEKSGEISISIMSFGENDPDPTVVAIPVDLSRFLNPLE